MTRNNQELDEILDRSTEAIRTQQVESSEVKTAGDRVWARISAERTAAAEATMAESEHINGCDDFQSLIPAYLRGNLTSARALLLEDHTHECVPCRRAVKQARQGKSLAAARRTTLQPASKTSANTGW
jgi:hypothetical protein